MPEAAAALAAMPAALMVLETLLRVYNSRMEVACCAQVCLGAAAALAAMPAALRALGGWLLPRRATLWAAWLAPRAALTVAAALSAMRIAALVVNYGAPMAVYRHLPEVPCAAACGRPLVAPSWGAGVEWPSAAEHWMPSACACKHLLRAYNVSHVPHQSASLL